MGQTPHMDAGMIVVPRAGPQTSSTSHVGVTIGYNPDSGFVFGELPALQMTNGFELLHGENQVISNIPSPSGIGVREHSNS